MNVTPVVTLTSATATQNQTVDEGNAITTTTYALSGSATSYTISGLPAGLNHSFNTSTKVITISGTPTTVGSYTYTITTTGHTAPCTEVAISGSVKVESKTGVCNIFNPGIIGIDESCTTFNAGTIGQ